MNRRIADLHLAMTMAILQRQWGLAEALRKVLEDVCGQTKIT